MLSVVVVTFLDVFDTHGMLVGVDGPKSPLGYMAQRL